MSSILERPTILVVEDDPDVREVLGELLGELGYRAVTAASAEQALEVVNVVVPDLILTDVHMGAMSGLELCARLKADPRYEFTPVVMLTAVADLDSRIAGLAAGADDFFPSPSSSGSCAHASRRYFESNFCSISSNAPRA